MNPLMEVEILKLNLSTRKTEKVKDCVADEEPFHLFLNRTHVVSMMCSPTNLRELAIGYFLSEGVVKSAEEIKEVTLNKAKRICTVIPVHQGNCEKRLRFFENRPRMIRSSCGETASPFHRKSFFKIKSSLRVRAQIVAECVNGLNSLAEIYRRTGGTHAAAIFTVDGTTVCFAEDVGRHNAVDKVIGMASIKNAQIGECFLASTGRLTGEIALKAVTVGLPVVASLAAPVSSGVSVALDAGLTLVGFVRGQRMNVYTFPERILS